MLTADHTNFVSVLSEEKPVMVFFHELKTPANTTKIRDTLKEIKKVLPLLPLYEFVIDQDENNLALAEYLEFANLPVLIFYKGGNFHRFKPNNFTKKSILSFIGNRKPYEEKTENVDCEDMQETSEDMQKSTNKKVAVKKSAKNKTTKKPAKA